MSDAAEIMRSRLREDLKAAMRSREAGQVSLLRTLIAAIDNAQAIPAAAGHQPYVGNRFGDGDNEMPRLQLSEAEVRAVLAREAAARIEAADAFDRHGEALKAGDLREEAASVRGYIEGDFSA